MFSYRFDFTKVYQMKLQLLYTKFVYMLLRMSVVVVLFQCLVCMYSHLTWVIFRIFSWSNQECPLIIYFCVTIKNPRNLKYNNLHRLLLQNQIIGLFFTNYIWLSYIILKKKTQHISFEIIATSQSLNKFPKTSMGFQMISNFQLYYDVLISLLFYIYIAEFIRNIYQLSNFPDHIVGSKSIFLSCTGGN